MDDPQAIVSPGGVGFDINCGVRLIRTNLREEDVTPVKEQLAQALFDHIPVGVGSKVRPELATFFLLNCTFAIIVLGIDPQAIVSIPISRASFQHLEMILKRRLKWGLTGACVKVTPGQVRCHGDTSGT